MNIEKYISPPFSESEKEEIIKLYLEGYGAGPIAEKFNCSRKKIHNLLKKHNIKIRPRGKIPFEQRPKTLTKKCISCLIEKDNSEFPMYDDVRKIPRNQCQDCFSNGILYRDAPKIQKEKIKKTPRRGRTDEERRILRNQWSREERKNNPEYKLQRSVSNAIYKGLKNNLGSKDGESFIKYVSYSMKELRIHLESLWDPWMNWNNWAMYNPKTHDQNPTWNIDHIVPISHFSFVSMKDEDFKKCWALQNLRPLDAKINLSEQDNRIFESIDIRPMPERIIPKSEFSKLQQQEIINLFVDDKWSIRKIADKFQKSYPKIRRVLVNNNIPILYNATKHAVNLTKDQEKEVVELYKNGMSMINIRIKFKCSIQLIRDILFYYDIVVRKRGPKGQKKYAKNIRINSNVSNIFTIKQELLILKLYLIDLLNFNFIAEIFYCHANKIKKVLSSHGVEIRRRGAIKEQSSKENKYSKYDIDKIRQDNDIKKYFEEFTEEQSQQIISLYQSGIRIHELAAQFNTTKSKITKHLKCNNIEVKIFAASQFLTEKQCTTCNQIKDISQFGKKKTKLGTPYYVAKCYECCRESRQRRPRKKP